MSLLKMKILELINRHKQVTAVANALQMKQPTISFHMKNMESEMGIKLFEAKSGRIHLTQAGKMLLPYATRIGALYSEAESMISEFRNNERSVLRVGCTDCAMTTIARSSWPYSIKNHAEIQFSMKQLDEESLFDQLHAGLLDVVICGRPARAPLEFQFSKMSSSPLKLLVPVGHPLAQKRDLAPHHLVKYDFLDYMEPSVYEFTKQWKNQLSWEFNVSARFASIELLLSAVHANVGLAVLPECTLPDSLQDVIAITPPGIISEWEMFANWSPSYWNVPLLKQILGIPF
jgi:DNA-binding transcriptional LysR family regulator